MIFALYMAQKHSVLQLTQYRLCSYQDYMPVFKRCQTILRFFTKHSLYSNKAAQWCLSEYITMFKSNLIQFILFMCG